MEKLISKKINTCVFISGTGSNLKYIIKNSREYNFPAKITLVISDQKKAKGLLLAKKNKISNYFIEYKNKYDFEKKILLILKKNKIHLICLAGFMKILSKNFLNNFKYKIINIHPSLLPKYKGLNTHYKAIKNKDNYSGCTVHYVDTSLDGGKIILQKRVNINKYETEKSLKKKILTEEHKIFSKAIRFIC